MQATPKPCAIQMLPVGRVVGGRREATKDGWGKNRCTLALDPTRFGPEALSGLEALSHLQVLFYFHLDAEEAEEVGARHPRGRTDWPCVGIFAQHGRMRPNRIGTSYCRILAVYGTDIDVEGLDAVDGSPLLDLKPVWMEYLPSGELRQPDWSHELMAFYW
ncbi:TrmO family methyltransferase [Polaromonas sp.]|uniref:TrmO family methyltransferase domain-containing protein n=1 Tax=Polaromonas sp. TaxID=1869339 RepID=UPI003266ED26